MLAPVDAADENDHCPLQLVPNLTDSVGDRVFVTYSWSAHEGRMDDLVAQYQEVLDQMQGNEQDTQEAHCFVDTTTGTLHVRDDFRTDDAVMYHLTVKLIKPFPWGQQPGDWMQSLLPGRLDLNACIPVIPTKKPSHGSVCRGFRR